MHSKSICFEKQVWIREEKRHIHANEVCVYVYICIYLYSIFIYRIYVFLANGGR